MNKISFKLSPRFKKILLFTLIIFLLISSYLSFWPIQNSKAVNSDFLKRLDYAESVNKFADLSSKEGDEINDACKTKLLTHGGKATKSIVLFHGYTNCPEQFSALGKSLFNQGYNVFIPRLPYHGEKDRLTDNLSKLTSDELKEASLKAIQIASGLGANITVMGISVSGVLCTWLGTVNPLLNHIVIISPIYLPKGIPDFAQKPLYRGINALPVDYQRWWGAPQPDANTHNASNDALYYAYPRFSYRGINQFFQIAINAEDNIDARNIIKPSRVTLVTNANDKDVDGDFAKNFVKKWEKNSSSVDFNYYEFPAELKLKHDLIDKNQSKDNEKVVYPKLLEIVNN